MAKRALALTRTVFKSLLAALVFSRIDLVGPVSFVSALCELTLIYDICDYLSRGSCRFMFSDASRAISSS